MTLEQVLKKNRLFRVFWEDVFTTETQSSQGLFSTCSSPRPQALRGAIYDSLHRNRIYIPFAIFILLSFTGCASIGPRTVARDRFDYITAISDSWKAQMLLNLVKLRYGDAPVFLDVASIITQTGVQGTLAVSGSWWQNLLQLPFTSSVGVTPRGLMEKSRP